ncbi:MAG: S-layer protein [Candidatus Micrarchaeota archaeon]|nr:S-layer protein [Candidatus Micrarchaeota archaeon]
MNGINLKRLGAIVAGGAILASSVAFAGLWYGNTELVNANGQPVAKIVVGEKAAASDGVAAAMIAAKIANSAYTEKEYTAAISGTANCVAGGNATGGSAACSVTDKTTTLEIIYPGMTGTAVAEIKPLIAEDLDNTLSNRAQDNQTEISDFADAESAPFQDGDGAVFDAGGVIEESDGDDAGVQYYKIDGNMLSALSDVTVSSKQTSSTFTEQQYIYLRGNTAWQNDEKKVMFAPDVTAYLTTFGPDDDGLSLCPGDTTKALYDCDTNDQIGKGRYTIKLFGSQWVVSDIISGLGDTPVANSGNDVTDADEGTGYLSDTSVSVADENTGIRLAKEATYNPALHKDECMNTTDVKICLSDISRETGATSTHPAIMTIYDAAGNHVTEKQISEGTTETVTVNGKNIKIHVYQTAPGYAMSSMWAEIAIYSDEIELYSGKDFTYGLKGYTGDDSKWKAYIGLVSTLGTDVNGTVGDATGLKAIWITSNDPDAMGGGEVLPGDSYNIIDTANYQGFVVKNNGLETATMDTVKMDYKSAATPLMNGTSLDKSVKLTSSTADAFKFGNAKGKTMYVGYDGSDPYIIIDDTQDGWVTQAATDGDVNDIEYKWGGKNAYVVFGAGVDAGTTSLSDTAFTVTISENVGNVDDDDTAVEELSVYADTTNDELLAEDTADTDTDKIGYVAATAGSIYDPGSYAYDGATEDVGFVSMRGTEFSGESSTSRTFKVPKSERHVLLSVAPTSVNASQNAEVIGPLHVGDSKTVGGSITVKVDAIDVQTSASVSGGSVAGCVADVSGQTAVIKDAAGASVSKLVAKDVYAVPSDLVMLDSQASDAKTIITVGGNKVNTVTAAAMQGAAVDLSASNPVVVKEIEGKIIVAGWSAADTLTATSNFIAGMKAQQ